MIAKKIYFENLDETSKWHKINIIVECLIETLKNKEEFLIEDITIDSILYQINAYGLNSNKEEIVEIINELIIKGIFSKQDNKIFINCDANERSDFLREIAIKFNLYNYIKEEFESALTKGEKYVKELLVSYDKILNNYNFIPIESQYPVLKAIALMNKEKIERIKQIIEDKALIDMQLVCALYLMLDKNHLLMENYVNTYLKNLEGRNYYYVSAEFSILAGGLGRVGQYLLPFIKKFGIKTIVIEPYYKFDIHMKEVEYEKIPTYVKFMKQDKSPDKEYDIFVHKKKVHVYAYHGKNYNDIDVWMVNTNDWFYTKQIYGYNYDNNYHLPSIFEFTEFFSKAALQLIYELEKDTKEKLKSKYKEPIIHCNDGQTALLPLFSELYYKNTIIENALIWLTTHTYINRIKNFGEYVLHAMDIPKDYFWMFLRKSDDSNTEILDITSCGIRAISCCATYGGINGVSAKHTENILNIDPLCKIIGITNGDNIEFSSAYFTEIFKNLFPNADIQNPTIEEIIAVKKKAKESLSLDIDPENIVISYSGRFVREKNGRTRAFTNENIEAFVKEGANVVIYGNYMDEKTKNEFKILQENFKKKNYKGHFVFKDNFNINDQQKLLAATDIQVQDSDYNTEAAGYTEADVSSCAGLQFAPPYLEGVLQQQGIILNRNKEGYGNTIIPSDINPNSYKEAILWLIKKYNEENGKEYIAKYQITSLKLSKILRSSITAMAYLNAFNDAFSNPISKRDAKRNFDENLSKNEISIKNFECFYNVFSNKIKIIVYINPNNVKSELISVNLKIRNNKNEFVTIPFKFLGSKEGVILYELCLEKEKFEKIVKNSPIVECEIISTSGLWLDSKKIYLGKV